MDGGIGVDTVEKEEIIKDARNKFICNIYSTGSPLETTIKDLACHFLINKDLYWKTRFL